MKVLINGTEYVPVPFRPDRSLPMHQLFKQARRKRGVPYRVVSEATGVSMSAICQSESGSGVTLLTAIKLCRFYQIDLDTLADSVLAHGIPNDAHKRK